MKFVLLGLSALALVFFAHSAVISNAEAGGWHKRGLVVCKNRMANKPRWQKGHYAFAISEAGQHCGWSYGKSRKVYAYKQALRTCKQRAHTPCRVVYAK